MRSILNRATVPLILAAAIGAAAPDANQPPVKRPTRRTPVKLPVRVTISKETTYITEPLREDGYVDYIAALNQRASEGVTPENNAAVLFWKAMGPRLIELEGEKFFKMLGIARLPEKGDYFIPVRIYARDSTKSNTAGDRAEEELEQAIKRPWSKREFPVLAGWLKANEKPLALITEASRRPRRYDPLVCGVGECDPMVTDFAREELVNLTLLVGVYRYQEAARALAAQAMLRTGEGKARAAWEDLLSCHRLARLAAQGVFPEEVWFYAGSS
jgi:hypothetical protein